MTPRNPCAMSPRASPACAPTWSGSSAMARRNASTARAVGRRLAQIVESLIVRLVGLRRRRPGPAQASALGRGQHGADALGDGAGDLGLQRQRIAQRSLELLRPDLRVAAGRDQPGVDAYPIRAAVLAANDRQRGFDDVVDAQLLADLDHRRRAIAELQHRRQRRHLQRLNLAERRDQLIGELVGEVGRRRIARDVSERQDRHARDRGGGRRPASSSASRR